MSTSLAHKRLIAERQKWRADHPTGFSAKFRTDENGNADPFHWVCKIPGRKGGVWEMGEYSLTMEFCEDYPSKPPKCKLPANFFHPNIYPSGTVCLSILNEDEDWRPAITIKQILQGIQDLLEHPNPSSPAQVDAFLLYSNNREAYDKRARLEAAKYRPKD